MGISVSTYAPDVGLSRPPRLSVITALPLRSLISLHKRDKESALQKDNTGGRPRFVFLRLFYIWHFNLLPCSQLKFSSLTPAN